MQTEYGFYPKKGLAGLIQTTGQRAADSFAAEGPIHAGAPLIRGTDPGTQVKAAAAGDGEKVFAVAAWEYKDAVEGALYGDKQTVSALRSGKIWVEVAGDVTPGALAYLAVDGGRAKFSADSEDEALGVGVVFESAAEDGIALVSVGGVVNVNITNITEGEG